MPEETCGSDLRVAWEILDGFRSVKQAKEGSAKQERRGPRTTPHAFVIARARGARVAPDRCALRAANEPRPERL